MPNKRTHKRSGRGSMTVSKVKKIANSVINQKAEKKYFTQLINVDGSADVTLGTIFDMNSEGFELSSIAQGDGQAERVGSEIELLSLKIRLLDWNTNSHYRMLIIHFPDDDGSDFTSADNFSVNANKLSATFLPSKKDYEGRYRVIYDRVHKLDVDNNFQQLRTISVPVKGIKVSYDDDATTIRQGNVKCFLFTDSTGKGIMGDLYGQTKWLYTDL